MPDGTHNSFSQGRRRQPAYTAPGSIGDGIAPQATRMLRASKFSVNLAQDGRLVANRAWCTSSYGNRCTSSGEEAELEHTPFFGQGRDVEGVRQGRQAAREAARAES
jgi:hypothetical protein